MKKAYVVLQGEYSDFEIVTVFLNKSDADKYIDYTDDDCLYARPYIEEYEIVSPEKALLIETYRGTKKVLYFFEFNSLMFIDKKEGSDYSGNDGIIEEIFNVKKKNGISTGETIKKKLIQVSFLLNQPISSSERLKIATDKAAQLKADHLTFINSDSLVS
jgi:hypothetical protein